MGIKQNVYIGAYVQATVCERQVYAGEMVCPVCGEARKTGLFCPDDGEELVASERKVSYYSGLDDLIEEREDDFQDVLVQAVPSMEDSKDGRFVLIGNYVGDSVPEDDLYAGVEITPALIDEKLKRFEIDYAEIISFLRKCRDVVSLVVKFGAVVWYC